jgi:hypothetical protein
MNYWENMESVYGEQTRLVGNNLPLHCRGLNNLYLRFNAAGGAAGQYGDNPVFPFFVATLRQHRCSIRPDDPDYFGMVKLCARPWTVSWLSGFLLWRQEADTGFK